MLESGANFVLSLLTYQQYSVNNWETLVEWRWIKFQCLWCVRVNILSHRDKNGLPILKPLINSMLLLSLLDFFPCFFPNSFLQKMQPQCYSRVENNQNISEPKVQIDASMEVGAFHWLESFGIECSFGNLKLLPLFAAFSGTVYFHTLTNFLPLNAVLEDTI